MSEERIIVTDENFGDLLIQAAEEALTYVRGDTTKARVRMRAVVTSPLPALDNNRSDGDSGERHE